MDDPFADAPFPREAKVALYVIGLLDDLKQQGLVEGGWLATSEKGRQQYEDLKASGFRPTTEEITMTMNFLTTRKSLSGAAAASETTTPVESEEALRK